VSGKQRERLAGIFAKFVEILFWLIVVGPFVARGSISLSMWLVLMLAMLTCMVLSVRLSGTKGGARK